MATAARLALRGFFARPDALRCSAIVRACPALAAPAQVLPQRRLRHDDKHVYKQSSGDQRYVDCLTITARAGAGGAGSAAMVRPPGRHAVADGGNGGEGGDVVVVASAKVKGLSGIPKTVRGKPGGQGGSNRSSGRNGEDAIIRVPVGTLVSLHRIEPLVEEVTRADVEAGDAGDAAADDAGFGLLGGEHPSAGAGGAADAPVPKTTRSSAANAPGRDGKRELVHRTQPTVEYGPVIEDELPDWIKRWRRPYYGDSDEDLPMGNEGEDDPFAPGGARRRGEDAPPEVLEPLADLVEDGQRVVVCRGGRGGAGNSSMRARAHRPQPRYAQAGEPGENVRLTLELKLLANVGLVGFPNAGKSSLLRALTAAKPKVAGYAFTTLSPQLGTLDAGLDDPLVLADIPGIVHGAHRNRGLGHAFLRHAERTRAIAYVIDLSAGRSKRQRSRRDVDGFLDELEAAGDGAPSFQDLSAAEQLLALQAELKAYACDVDLSTLPALVIANKLDLVPVPGPVVAELERVAPLGAEVVPVSAHTRQGLDDLVAAIRDVYLESLYDDARE